MLTTILSTLEKQKQKTINWMGFIEISVGGNKLLEVQFGLGKQNCFLKSQELLNLFFFAFNSIWNQEM